MNERISPHFTFNEMTTTEVRQFVDENRDVPADKRENLRLLCEDVLEEVRALIGLPMIVHSGYRSPALNWYIGGAKNSEHMDGNACDFHIQGMGTPAGIQNTFDMIRRSGIPFGQLIRECNSWVHISRATEKHQHEVLTFDGKNYERLA